MVDPARRKVSKPYRNAYPIRNCKGYATKKKVSRSTVPMITLEMLTGCPPMVLWLRHSFVWIPF